MRCAALALLVVMLPAVSHSAEEAGGGDSRQAAQNAGAATIAGKDPGLAIEADQLSKPPKLTKQAKVDYPKQALGQAGEVEVILLVDLDDKGTVVGAAVDEPKTTTGLGFEEVALTAAYDLAFEPAEVAGKPVPVQIVYKFKFVPPKPPAPEPPKVAQPEPPKPAPVENLTGTLVERGTRLPLAGILVTVYRTEGDLPVGFEATTDAKGGFHFYDLEPGSWKVRIEPSAYYPVRTSEEIVKGERTNVTYYVERGSYNPFDVVVEAKRERKEVSRTVIESAVIEKLPGAMGDAIAVVQNFAGVARAQVGSGQIMIRGSGPHDTAYFLDGTSIPNIYHFGGIRSVIPTGMIDTLQFYPGNFSPYYSGANGGIVDIDL
jgi:TonB family protein